MEVYEGQKVLNFTQDANDWRNPDQLPDDEGTPGKLYTLSPSYYGFEDDSEAILIESLDENNVPRFFLTVLPTGQLKDIAYLKELEVTNSTYLKDAVEEFPGIALSNIPIFDIESASWEHIKEFRGDPSILKCMRDIRLFVRDNFEGKPLAYIEDSLGQLIDSQERLSKYHGIALYKGVLIDVIQDRFLHTALTSSIVLAITGNSRAALGSAITTLTLGIGKISISFSQKVDNKKLLEANEPVTYLIKMKDSFIP